MHGIQKYFNWLTNVRIEQTPSLLPTRGRIKLWLWFGRDGLRLTVYPARNNLDVCFILRRLCDQIHRVSFLLLCLLLLPMVALRLLLGSIHRLHIAAYLGHWLRNHERLPTRSSEWRSSYLLRVLAWGVNVGIWCGSLEHIQVCCVILDYVVRSSRRWLTVHNFMQILWCTLDL